MADPAGSLEVERKYLLTGMPPHARSGRKRVIRQGYIPGQKLQERLREVTEPDGSMRCFRTVKLGRGVSRLEVEEETPHALFERMWPLTEGARLEKTRWVVEDGGVVWEVDEFTDRDLVLAEVELGSADEEVTFPEWLRPYVVREVTEEDAYVNLRLAR